jgi:hypothetical protein
MIETARKMSSVKAAKADRINRKISKGLNSEWGFIPTPYTNFIKLVGNVLLIPVAIFMGLLEGIRAGFIAGMEKTLQLYK